MTNKENYLNALNHKKTEWTPVHGASVAITGYVNLPFEKGPLGGGYDGFGVRWVVEKSSGGNAAPMPAPGELALTDVTKWKELPFPDVESYDWQGAAESFLATVDRNQIAVDFSCGNGQFERLVALMGFENALMAMYEEPEAVYELLEAITDYKIKIVKKVAQYYHADTFTNFDDVASQKQTMMSPEMYKELISPHHKRLNQAIREAGMLPVQHCCGYASDIVECFIDEEAAAWNPVQPHNDIVALCKTYGDKVIISGGYDTNGLPGQTTDEEIIRAEARRCIDAYGGEPNYVFMGFLLFSGDQGATFERLEKVMNDEADRYAKEKAGII